MSEKAVEARKLAGQGLEQLKLGHVDSALRILEDAGRMDPTNFSIQFGIASAVSDKGEFDRAIHLFRKAKRGGENAILADYNIACCLHKKGELDEAARQFLAVAKRGDDSLQKRHGAPPPHVSGASTAVVSSSYVNAGLCLEARKRNKEAYRLFERAVSRDGDNPYHRALLGVGAYKMGENIDVVENHFDKALALDSGCFLAMVGKGVVEETKGDTELALKWFQDAYECRKADIAPLFRSGQLLLKLERFQEAHAVFVQCGMRQPESPTVLFYTGLALAGRGEAHYAEAVSAFEAVLKKEPKNRASQFYIAMLKKALGQEEDLLARLKRATLAVSPDSSAFVALGTAYLDLGRLKQAEGAYRAALRISQSDALAHAGLGSALQCQHNDDGALEEYRKAVELDSSLLWARYNLGCLFEKKGKFEEALHFYEQVTKSSTLSSTANAAIAGVLIKQGLFEEAQRRARQAVYTDPRCTKALLCLGICSVRLGRRDEIRTVSLVEGLRILESTTPNTATTRKTLESNLDIEKCLFQLTIGIAQHLQENLPAALASYQQAIATAQALLKAEGGRGRSSEQEESKAQDASALSSEERMAVMECRGCASMNTAAVYQSLGDVQSAVAQYRKTLQWDPTNKSAYSLLKSLSNKEATSKSFIDAYYRAVGLHENKQFEEATRAYEEALRLNDKDHLSLCGIGMCHLALKHYSEAISYFKRCLTVKPDDERARIALVAAYSASGSARSAFTEAEAAAELLPSSAEVQANYALMLMQQDKTQEAIKRWRKAIALKGALPFGRYSLGLALCAAAEYKDAVNELKIAIQQQPAHLDARLAMAQACQVLGEAAEAEEQYRHILAAAEDAVVSTPPKLIHLNPLSQQILEKAYPARDAKYFAAVGLAQLAHHGKDVAKAKEFYTKALQYQSNGLHALVGLAALEEHAGNFHDAVDLLHTAATVNPLDDEIPHRLNKLIAFIKENNIMKKQ